MNWLKSFWKQLNAPPSVPASPTTSSTVSAAKVFTQPSIPSRLTSRPAPTEDGLSNFTPRAQQVLALARTEAERFNHNFVGTEHLLLGIVALEQGTAVSVLRNMGLDLELIRAEVEKHLGIGPDQKMIGNLPYTPRVKKVLAFANKERKALNHTYLGTEHILLGLLREGDGLAARVLKNLDVDAEKTRQEILKVLDPNFSPAEASPAPLNSGPGETPVDRSRLARDFFTPRVRRAFTLAREEAEHRNQPFIETEHVLLGLIRMGEGVAASVLIKIGVNAETVGTRIQDRAEELAGRSPEEPQFAPLVKEVLSFASEEAQALEHTYIGTEHILLGLLRQPQGGAARIFKELFVDTEALRKQIVIAFEVKTPGAKNVRDQVRMQLGEKDTEMFDKKSSMPTTPAPAKPSRQPVDTTLRYDVYCVERNSKMVVYRNVLIKSVKMLFPRNDYDQSSDFVELEQADGQTLFVAKASIVRFCRHGVKAEPEEEPGQTDNKPES